MFNVCSQCGEYSDRKTIDPSGPFAVCPHCGHPHRFVQLPLFVLTGASGSGKTTIALHLVAALPECVTMESDILWGAVAATADDDYRGYRNTWLRVAKNIGQSGRPVVLVGSALAQQFEACPERRYFTEIHYLAVVCDNEILAQRLRDRPAWRRAGTTEFIADMCTFNAYLRDNAGSFTPPMATLDTGLQAIEESTTAVIAWVRERLPVSRAS
jgi:predicted kinase